MLKKVRQNQYFSILMLLLVLVAFWAVFRILSPGNFGTPDRLLIYAKSALIYAIGGCGLYFICSMGPFDMSVGSNIVLSSIIACQMCERFGYAGLVIAPIIVGTLLGFINGMMYIRLHISSLIVTVAMALIYEAIAVFAAGGKNVILPSAYRAFGDYPWNLVLAVFAYLLCAFILKYTKIGTYTYAIGSNEVVAKNMGVNVNRYKVVAFTLAGMFYGMQAILTISYGTSITAAMNLSSMSRNFTPLMGTFFGLAFKKYGHPVIAIVIGEMIIQLLFNGFVAMGAPTTIQNIVTGVALLLIVTITTRPVKGTVVK